MRGVGSVAGLLLLLAVACTSPGPARVVLPERLIAAGVAAMADAGDEGAFERFRLGVADAASASGDEALATLVRGMVAGRPVEPANRRVASRLLRAYVVARYGDSMVSDLREMIGFRTFAVEGRENWDAPEFLRQREWLRVRAEGLGLDFRSFDGRVDEITLAGGERVLGLLTHGDVQDVAGQEWSSPPWEARVIDGKIVGRGSEDDKGPIVTSLYVLAALRESGWPLGASVRLMIANGEESSWAEIPYYLERRDAPDVTLGIDAAYPVTHAQKAWCSVRLTAPSKTRPVPDGSWTIVSITGGSGLSIIPEFGKALLRPPDGVPAGLTELRSLAEDWAERHPKARLDVEASGDLVRLTARGEGGHSSEPESGHNALGDLTAFLAELPPAPGGWGTLAGLLGKKIGTETDGESLGLAYRDEVMGELTVNLGLLGDEDGRPRAGLSLRVPRGLELETIEGAFAELAAEVERTTGIPVSVEARMPGPPHFVPPDGPLVRTLLGVWEDVTGEPGVPVAIGGGTQARLFPDGVDFGPALAMETYRGHGPDEYLTVEELHRNAELTLAAIWALAEH